MQRYNYCFIDLDDTLYDTRRFKDDIYSVFVTSGISWEEFIIAYRRAAELPKLGYYNYTFERQIDAVREMGYEVGESALESLNQLFKINYVKPGALDFIEYLKQISGLTILLTAGTIDFQAKKIEAANLRGHFSEIIQIPGGKDAVLKDRIKPGENALFINDNLDENLLLNNLFENVKIVTLFNPSYWTEDDCRKSGLPFFKNYENIIEYLTNLE